MAAVWDETFGSFPQVDGGIMDGWTESAYELEWHHGNAVFADIPESTKAQAAIRGYDPDRLERGRRHLHERFRNLTPAEVRYYGAYGVLSEMNLFDINEDAIYWLRWRRVDGIKTGEAFRRELDKSSRRLLLGNGPRSAVFSGMTALDFHAWGKIVDVLPRQALLLASRFRRYVRHRRPLDRTDSEMESSPDRTGLLYSGESVARCRFTGGQLSLGHGFGVSPSLL